MGWVGATGWKYSCVVNRRGLCLRLLPRVQRNAVDTHQHFGVVFPEIRLSHERVDSPATVSIENYKTGHSDRCRLGTFSKAGMASCHWKTDSRNITDGERSNGFLQDADWGWMT